MGTVVRFHDARASGSARAAKPAKTSAVKPAFCAVEERNIGSHHSAGILSLCGHLRAANTDAPTSDAKASGESQSATTSRKLETMTACLGQLVLKRKPALSQDQRKVLGHNVPMDKYAKKALAAAVIARTRQARALTDLGQHAISEALGIEQGLYKHYETRTPMPMIYHEKFCEICGVNLQWLRDGTGPQQVPRSPRKNISA